MTITDPSKGPLAPHGHPAPYKTVPLRPNVALQICGCAVMVDFVRTREGCGEGVPIARRSQVAKFRDLSG
jgi:hypothetical protein